MVAAQWVGRSVAQMVTPQIVQTRGPQVVEKEERVLRAEKVVQEEMKEGKRVAQVPPEMQSTPPQMRLAWGHWNPHQLAIPG